MKNVLPATILCIFIVPLQAATADNVNPYYYIGPKLEGYHHKIHSDQYSDEEKRLLKKLWISTLGNASRREIASMSPKVRRFFEKETPHMTAEEYQAYRDAKVEGKQARYKQDKRNGAFGRIESSRKRIEKSKRDYERIEESVIATKTGIYSEKEMEKSLNNYKRQRDSKIYRLEDHIREAERQLAEMEPGGNRGKSLESLDDEDKTLRRKQMERATLAKQNAVIKAMELKRHKLKIDKEKYARARSSEVRTQNEHALLGTLARIKKQKAIEKQKSVETIKKQDVTQKRFEKKRKKVDAARIKKILAREKSQKKFLEKYKAQRGY